MKTAKRKVRHSKIRINRDYKQIDFFKKWLRSFVPNLTSEQYKKYIDNQYVWHVFSFEIVPKDKFLSGDAARKAYNEINKKNALTFQLWFDEKPMPITEEFDKAEKLENSEETYAEFYVVSKDFKWTYIVTHETDWGLGPYFMKID